MKVRVVSEHVRVTLGEGLQSLHCVFANCK